jgi:tetratricopeptide (TPR) repeat protein
MKLGRYADAEAAARRRLDLSPEGSGGHSDLALALLMQNRVDEALLENARDRGPRARLLGAGAIYHAMGRHAEADAALDELQKYASIDPMYVAELSAYRGDIDRAFAALNAGVDAGVAQVYLVKVDFLLDSLRSDPRYRLLLQRMHLPV